MKNSDRTKKIQEKETLRSNIRSHILQGIMDGTFKAGERIVETRLAKELDVSQAPVREAILELSVMGLLEEKPYSGTFVRAITAEDLEDIFHCRAIIEEFNPGCMLEVDGGINQETASLAREAGADVLVAGSGIYGLMDRAAAIRALREA